MQTIEEHSDDRRSNPECSTIVSKNYETNEGDLKLHKIMVKREYRMLKRLAALCFVLFIITAFPYASIYAQYYNQEAMNYKGINTDTFAANCVPTIHTNNNLTAIAPSELHQPITLNQVCPSGYTVFVVPGYINSVLGCMHNYHYKFYNYNRSDAEIKQIVERICQFTNSEGNIKILDDKTYPLEPKIINDIFIYGSYDTFVLYLIIVIIEVTVYQKKKGPSNTVISQMPIYFVLLCQVANVHIFAGTMTRGFTFFDPIGFHYYLFLVCVLNMTSLVFVYKLFSLLEKYKMLDKTGTVIMKDQ